MATLRWRPRFVFGSTDLTLDLSMRPWRPSVPTIGGRLISAAGIPASHIVRRDNILHLRVRLRETEWEPFLAMVEWGQGDQPLTVYPDAANAGDSSTVYLERPAPGEDMDWQPERDENAEWVMEVDMSIRSTDGSSLWRPYFALT